jgi:hypothetical protein
MINDAILLFLIDNLTIKDIIKLFITNKYYYNFMKKKYKIICKLYYPKYNILTINDFHDCNKIHYQNLYYINKLKLINFIKINPWSNNFFNYKYININNKEDTYIHSLILNIMKNIFIVKQLDIKEDNEKFLNKNKIKQFIYDIGISYYSLKLELLNETEILKKDLDNYLKNNIKEKLNYNYNLYKIINYYI